jgi:hypothetical protein
MPDELHSLRPSESQPGCLEVYTGPMNQWEVVPNAKITGQRSSFDQLLQTHTVILTTEVKVEHRLDPTTGAKVAKAALVVTAQSYNDEAIIRT